MVICVYYEKGRKKKSKSREKTATERIVIKWHVFPSVTSYISSRIR